MSKASSSGQGFFATPYRTLLYTFSHLFVLHVPYTMLVLLPKLICTLGYVGSPPSPPPLYVSFRKNYSMPVSKPRQLCFESGSGTFRPGQAQTNLSWTGMTNCTNQEIFVFLDTLPTCRLYQCCGSGSVYYWTFRIRIRHYLLFVRSGSGSESFHHQPKKREKTLIYRYRTGYSFVTSLWLFIFEEWC